MLCSPSEHSWRQAKRVCRPGMSHLWQALDRKEDLTLLAP